MKRSKNRRLPLWLPYTSSISIKKTNVFFSYKGGEYSSDIKHIHSIMFYGAVCDIPESFLQLCVRNSVPLIIHRRNMSDAIWITPSVRTTTKEDVLEKQILARVNKKKTVHIVKRLLNAKFQSMRWLVAPPPGFSAHQTVVGMRTIEAYHARAYWQKYFGLLKASQYSRRGGTNPIKSTLDAVSKLIHGVILRYILYHRMSPYHAFLHIPTDYPSLTYDLMEPYRGYVDKVVFDTIRYALETGCEPKEYVARSIVAVEDLLNEVVYTHPTRQLVTFQELLHGSVLALRAYLQKEATRFILPIPSKPNGGRPVHAGYRLYGRSAGPTDFWEIAENVANKHERRMKNM